MWLIKGSLSRLTRTLHTLRSPSELLLFARVTAFAACVPVMVRLSLPRLAALLRAKGGESCEGAAEKAAQVTRCVDLAQDVASPVVHRGCLTRGVTLFWFLSRAGYPVELCFGIGRIGTEMAGHCWITIDGVAFCERADPEDRFSVLYRIPARSPS